MRGLYIHQLQAGRSMGGVAVLLMAGEPSEHCLRTQFDNCGKMGV